MGTGIVQDLDVDRRPCRSKGDPRGMRIELSGRKGKGSDAYRVDIVLDWIDIGIRSISLHERQHFGLLMVSIQHSPLFWVNMRDIQPGVATRTGWWAEPNLVGV